LAGFPGDEKKRETENVIGIQRDTRRERKKT
jgi:hypothetical protein